MTVEYREAKPFALRKHRHSKADLVLSGEVPAQGEAELLSHPYVRGPKETNTASIGFPLAYLDAGQSFTLRVVDRDGPLSGDLIAKFSIEYAGVLPLRASTGDAEVECVALSDEMLHSQAMTAAWEVERLLWRVANDSSTDAKDTAAARDISYAFYELAQWVGWSDPRVQARLSLLEDVWPDFPAVAEPENDPDPSSRIPPADRSRSFDRP